MLRIYIYCDDEELSPFIQNSYVIEYLSGPFLTKEENKKKKSITEGPKSEFSNELNASI